MKLKPFILKPLFLSVLFLTACNGSSFSPSAEEKAKEAFSYISTSDASPPPPPSLNETEAAGNATTTVGLTSKDYAREEDKKNTSASDEPVLQSGTQVKIPEKIKKTANISLTVEDYKKAHAAIESIIRNGNGYMGGENEQNNTYSISNTMVIRVMNKDFDKMVANLTAIDAVVNSKNVYTEDVTAQFVDITARLKSKKEVEGRYMDLLKRANTVTDILEVEEQLRVIREEIEAKEGELKYLVDQVDYSTINLSFHQDFEYSPTETPGFFGRMGNAFGNGWNGFLSFLIGIVYAWPLWIILFVFGYFLYKFIKKQVNKK